MKKVLKSFSHASRGIGYAFTGRNFQIQFSIGLVAVILGRYFNISTTEWLFIVLSGGLVLALEATNSALEEVCNKFHPESHPHIALIKDLAAGAVLIASIAATVIGILIFWPYLG